MMSDGLKETITPEEKQKLVKEYDLIKGEKIIYLEQCNLYDISMDDYLKAYDAFDEFMDPIFMDLNSSTIIDDRQWQISFHQYYKAKIQLLGNLKAAASTHKIK